MNPRKGRLLFILVFIGFLTTPGTGSCFAQEPLYRHYTPEEGLPSSEVFHVFQDSKGFIWFATDMGVSRYDGDEFQNFDIEDGLPVNTVFEIYEDYKGRIWFLTLSLELAYYKQGKIRVYPHNTKIQQAIGSKKRLYQKLTFHVDSSDNIYIGIKASGFYRIDTIGRPTKLTDNKHTNIEAFQFNNKLIVPKTSSHPSVHEELLMRQEGGKYALELNFLERHPIHRAFGLRNGERSIFYFDKNFIQMRDNRVRYQYYQDNVIWLSTDSKNRIWMGTSNGAYMHRNFDLQSERLSYLQAYNVSSVLEDHEGGFWFSTLQHGVFYAPNLNILYYSRDDDLASLNIEELASDSSGNIWIGYADPVLGRLYNGHITNYTFSSIGQNGIASLHYDDYLNRLWLGRWDNLCYMDLGKQGKKVERHQGIKHVKDIYIQGINRWLGMSNCVGYYQGLENIYLSHKDHEFRQQVGALYKRRDTLYIGALDGLWIYTDGEYHHLGKQNDLLYYRITEIAPFNDFLLLGTRGAGLLLKKNDKVYQITEKEGLISNSINAIAPDNDDIWLATNKGLCRIKLINAEEEQYQFFNLGPCNGLPSCETNDLVIQDSLMYVATGGGLAFYEMSHLEPNKQPPAVYAKKVEINEKDTLVRSSYYLSHDQNFFSVYYKGLSYRNINSLVYKYRMIGLDSIWKQTTRQVKRFTTLPHGEYVFQVKASNEDGIWSKNPLSIQFNIAKPYWSTWWFIGLVLLFIVGLIWAFIHYRIRMIKRRRELLQNINEYKQKILRQQMNPHFIFNTLNSIQYFLLDDDTTSSLTYLTKFAKLMRIVLDNSQHTFVSIEDEIRGLRLYLELEALRFEELFGYEIQIDDEINTFIYKVPALLIQPYVENSIRHGLLHKKGKGYLTVQLKVQSSSMFCIIEDNGVGRKKAGEIKLQKGHFKNSLGSKLTEERIEILNSLYSGEIDINYIDLTDDQGNARGTRVEIQFPFIY